MGRKGTGKQPSRKGAKKKAKSPKPLPPSEKANANGAQQTPLGSAASLRESSGLKSGKLVSPKKAAAGNANKARLVITHSTYIPGLIKLLEKLALCSEIQTITPAVISRVKSNSPRLRLKISVPITGGHKLIARKSKSAQEVFVITHWSKAELEQAIARILS